MNRWGPHRASVSGTHTSAVDAANWPQWSNTAWDAKPTTFSYHADGLAFYELRRPVNSSNVAYSLTRWVNRRDEAGRPLQERMPVTGTARYTHSRYGVDAMRIVRQEQGGQHLRYVRDGGAVVGVLARRRAHVVGAAARGRAH